MKTLITLALTMLVTTGHAYLDEINMYDDFINGGLSGGNDNIMTFSSTQKLINTRNIENLHKGKKEIVITIDDGPTPGVTDKILDTLKKHNIQATFFVIASKINKNRALFQRMLDEGHIVANHTLTHPNLANIKGFSRNKKLRKELLGAHDIIEPYMGNSAKFYLRAPFGAWSPKAAKVINKSEHGSNYYGPVLWDIGGSMKSSFLKVTRAADWACWSKRWSVKKCLRGYIYETEEKRGGVVLFHDLKGKSADLIKRYVETFAKRPDYSFVSLDDVKL